MNRIEVNRESIIITIAIVTYNLENYIIQSLDSILKGINEEQLKKLEFIICDDNSTDDTCVAIKQYFDNYPKANILLYKNEKNFRTAGHSFNYGLKNANGKYIHFLDGDDLVNPDVYIDFLEEVDKNIDLFDYQLVSFDKKISNSFRISEFKEEFIDNFPYRKSRNIFGKEIQSFTCNSKIYNVNTLKKYNLQFSETASYQDKEFNIKVYKHCPTVKYMKKVFSYYRCGILSNSTTIKYEKFEEHNELTKNLNKIFPKMVQDEKNYLVKLLLNANKLEVKKIVELFHKEEIFSNFYLPEGYNLFEWYNYLLQEGVICRNIQLIYDVIDNFTKMKQILNFNDYKVMNYYTNNFLNEILLVSLLKNVLFRKANNINKIKETVSKLFVRINFRETFNYLKDLKQKEQYYDFICSLIREFSKKEITMLLNNGKYPLFLKNKKDFMDFLFSYIHNPKDGAVLKYSTIMVSFNREQYVGKAIDSYVRNNYSASELIIVDNNSEEKTILLIEEKIKNLKNVKLIRLSDNNYGGARNYGISKAKGSYISFLDDDDELVSNYYETLDRYLIDNTIDVLRFNMLWVDSFGNAIPKIYYNNITKFHCETNISGKQTPQYLNSFRTSLSSAALSVVHRRLLNENTFVRSMVYEDTLMFNEISLTSNKIVQVSDVLYERKEHNMSIMSGENRKNNYEQRKFYLQSNYIVYKCNLLNLISIGEKIDKYKNSIVSYYKLAIARIGDANQEKSTSSRMHELWNIDENYIKKLIKNDMEIPPKFKEILHNKYKKYRNYEG